MKGYLGRRLRVGCLLPLKDHGHGAHVIRTL